MSIAEEQGFVQTDQGLFGDAEIGIMEALADLIRDTQDLRLPLDIFKAASHEDDGWFVTKWVTHRKDVPHEKGDKEKG